MTQTPDSLPYFPAEQENLQMTGTYHEYNRLRTEQAASLKQLVDDFLSVKIPQSDKRNKPARDAAQEHLLEKIRQQNEELDKLRRTLKSFKLEFTYGGSVDLNKSDKKALTILGIQNNMENV